MEIQLTELFVSAPFAISFLAGILTFFSPCVLPLIPAYLSYISGISVRELSEHGKLTRGDKLIVLKTALMFILGFSTIFILIGVSMAELIGNIFSYSWVNWIAGTIIILFGLHMARFINIKFLNYEKRAAFGSTQASGLLAPFILGVSFALGWTPCIGPIFAAIVSMAAQDPSKSVSLMVVYTIGLAVPFVVAAILTSSALEFFTKVKRHFGIIEKVGGLLLVLIGISIATGGLGRLTNMILGN